MAKSSIVSFSIFAWDSIPNTGRFCKYELWNQWIYNHSINSLWPSDPIWWHRSGSRLAQEFTCCLMPPSHYLNQCWLMTSEVLWQSLDGNFTRYFTHYTRLLGGILVWLCPSVCPSNCCVGRSTVLLENQLYSWKIKCDAGRSMVLLEDQLKTINKIN